ncbi:DNA primase, partial [termite gut metagenome]
MDTIKHISIKQYLQERGINPTIERDYYGMYCSP